MDGDRSVAPGLERTGYLVYGELRDIVERSLESSTKVFRFSLQAFTFPDYTPSSYPALALSSHFSCGLELSCLH